MTRLYFLILLKQGSIFVLLCFMSFSVAVADKINITTSHWYPYVSFSKDKQGVITQIVQATLKNMNMDFKIEKNEFDEGYKYTIENKYNATFPYFMTKQRKKEMYFSDSLLSVENVLFYNKTNFPQDLNNIYTYKIGVVKGYAYKNIQIDKFKNKITLDNELEAFEMLDKGKIDLLPSNKLVATHIIKMYFNDFHSNIDFIKDANFTSIDFLYFIASKNKKNKNLIEKFNVSLKEIKRKGEYKEILLKNRETLKAYLSNVIRLTNNTETFPMVVASSNPSSKKKYIIPRGTKAVVLQWSEHFTNEGKLKIYDEMFKKTKVQIINGPLKGKIVFVENMYIEIE